MVIQSKVTGSSPGRTQSPTTIVPKLTASSLYRQPPSPSNDISNNPCHVWWLTDMFQTHSQQLIPAMVQTKSSWVILQRSTAALPCNILIIHRRCQPSTSQMQTSIELYKQNPFPASLPNDILLFFFPFHFFPLMWHLQMCIKKQSSLGDTPICKSLSVCSCPFLPI